MCRLGKHKSVIREIFEYSKERAAKIGAENVFDFSLGNPNVSAPDSVKDTIRKLLDEKDDLYLHGYTSAQGDADTRQAVAEDLNRRYGTHFHADNFYMTCGAAASLKICLTALTVPGDEFLTFAPYFPEYQVFVETAGASFRPVQTEASDRCQYYMLYASSRGIASTPPDQFHWKFQYCHGNWCRFGDYLPG